MLLIPTSLFALWLFQWIFFKSGALVPFKPGAVSESELRTALANVDDMPDWIYFPDVERVEWLNRIIKRLWPHIGRFVEATVRDFEPMVS